MFFIYLLVGSLWMLSSSCLNVLVPNEPYSYLVSQLGKERLKVEAVVKQGGDVHHYDPTFAQIDQLKKNQLWIQIEQPYEIKLQNALSNIKLTLKLNQSSTTDPHFWLSFHHLKSHANEIAHKLIELDPMHKEEYQQNLQQFLDELALVYNRAIKQQQTNQLLAIATSHDALEYFCKELGIEQIALDSHGTELTIKELMEKKNLIKSLKVKKLIFIHPHGKKRAEKLANELGLQLIYFNPSEPDMLKNLTQLVDAIYENGT